MAQEAGTGIARFAPGEAVIAAAENDDVAEGAGTAHQIDVGVEGEKGSPVGVDPGNFAPGEAAVVGPIDRGAGFGGVLIGPAGFAGIVKVVGGEQGAIHATLAIMAGGDAAVLERVRPLLLRLGKTVVHIGDNGAGQVAKACNQMIMVAAIQACAEAMHLAAASGVDTSRLREALLGGSAGSRVLEVMGERMAERDFAAGIEARLHHKDFGILLAEAHALGAPLPVAAQVGQQLNALMGQGMGKDDTSSLLRVLEGKG